MNEKLKEALSHLDDCMDLLDEVDLSTVEMIKDYLRVANRYLTKLIE